MFGDWASIRDKVVVGVITAVVLGALTLLWNWSSSGGIVRALGGATQADVEVILKRLALAGPPAAGFPPGAVVAFATPCPTSGWMPFEEGTGRFIVGAGENFHRAYRMWQRKLPTGGFENVQLSTRTPLSAGGEEQHRLSVNEMPSHNHGFEIIQHFDYQRGQGGYAGTEDVRPATPPSKPSHRYTDNVGSGEPHDVMPPFIALFYCKKD